MRAAGRVDKVANAESSSRYDAELHQMVFILQSHRKKHPYAPHHSYIIKTLNSIAGVLPHLQA